MWMLMSNSRDGKLTIRSKILGFGTKQEQEGLNAFRDSLPKGAAMSDFGDSLMHRADISIEEFKNYMRRTLKAL